MLQFEQGKNAMICQKLCKSTSKMFQAIKQVYSEEALSHSVVLKWHKGFGKWEREFGR
jgi:hypothetical protein